jgi:hypothetical protein
VIWAVWLWCLNAHPEALKNWAVAVCLTQVSKVGATGFERNDGRDFQLSSKQIVIDHKENVLDLAESKMQGAHMFVPCDSVTILPSNRRFW